MPEPRKRINPLRADLRAKMDEILEDETGAAEPQIVYQDRVIEVQIEVPIEVTRPVVTDTDGVTWVGNIGVTSMGLDLPDALTKDEWRSFLNAIQSVKQSYQFVIGDWFAAGKDRFNVSYEEIAALTGFKVKTVEIWASACRNVPKFTRVNFLTFAHHRAVAVLPPERQLQALQYAFENGLSARQLADEIKGTKPRLKAGKKTKKVDLPVVDQKVFNRIKKSDEETRREYAAKLRKMANDLYPE